MRGAETAKVTGAVGGEPAPSYRIAEMSYDSLADLRAGLESSDGQAVLVDVPHFATGGATMLVVDTD